MCFNPSSHCVRRQGRRQGGPGARGPMCFWILRVGVTQYWGEGVVQRIEESLVSGGTFY